MRILCKATCDTCTGQKYCFSRDPIAKYDDCQDVLYADATQVMDLSRVCEYNHQIQVMSNPQVWGGNIKPFTVYLNMGSQELDCMSVIQDGNKVYDDSDSFDTRAKPGTPAFPFGQCCERVHQYFTCVGQPAKEKLIMKDTEGLGFLDQVSYNILGAFNSYCAPLFHYPSKPEFCAKYPKSDPCIVYDNCHACTEHKGIWCAGTQTCVAHEPPKGCIARVSPSQCPSLTGPGTGTEPLTTSTVSPPPTTTTTSIVPEHNWWYEIVGSSTPLSKDYIPSPYVSVKQGKPAHFAPESVDAL